MLPNSDVLAIEVEELYKPISLIDQIITTNYTIDSLDALQT
jgi:hypothetical protein